MSMPDTFREPFGLIVEDDSLYAHTLQRSLRKRGFQFEVAANPDEALALAHSRLLDLAVIDLYLGAQSGLDLIAPLRKIHPAVRVVMLTGYGTFPTAIAAIKRGANNYLLKPATVEAILQALLTDGEAPSTTPEKMTPLGRLEWEHIQQALKATMGNISAAARLLGMHRRSLQRKLVRQPPHQRDPGEGPFE